MTAASPSRSPRTPVIREILMVAFMNKDALERMLQTEPFTTTAGPATSCG